MVADCLPHSEKAGEGVVMDDDNGKKEGGSVVEHGNPVSQWDANAVPTTSRMSGNLMHFFPEKNLTFELRNFHKSKRKWKAGFENKIKLCKRTTSNVLDIVFQNDQTIWLEISASCNIFENL